MSAQQAPNGASEARDPSGFLSDIIGAPVTVKLNSGVVYKGTLPPSTDPTLFAAASQTAHGWKECMS